MKNKTKTKIENENNLKVSKSNEDLIIESQKKQILYLRNKLKILESKLVALGY